MKLIINEQINERYPSLSFGIIVAKRIDNSKKNSALAQIYDGLKVQIKKRFKDTDPYDMPKLANWRKVFEEISAKTFQFSMEKILLKVLKNKEIPFNDNLSRIRDYFMLKWQVPIMCFALDDIYGDIHLDIEKNNIFYRDQGSSLTKKWNSDQKKRGTVNRETENVVYIIENLGILSDEDLTDNLHEMAIMIQRYCHGGEFEEDILTFPRKEKDLNVVGLSEYDSSQYEDADMPKKEQSIEKKEEKPEKKKSEDTSLDTNSLKVRLTSLLKEACKKAYPEADVSSLKVEYPRDLENGDYACSIAMKLTKRLLKDPSTIAEKIIQNAESVQFVDSLSVALPGFINIKIARSWIESRVKDLAEGAPMYDGTLGQNRAVVFDYSSPNTAKPLGVHHLLSAIIGQALYNIYKHVGFKSVGINYLGDWGTQFGKLIFAYKTWGNKKTVEKNPIPELLKLYVKFHEEVEQDKSIEEKGREEFKKLEEGNEENLSLWKWFNEMSLEDLEKIYEKLGVHFDEYIGESFFKDKMKAVIDEGKEKGVFTEGDGGALIVKFKDDKYPPYMIRKSDGSTLYSTRDLTSLEYRIKRWQPAQLVYVVDTAQNLHFNQLFETARLMGFDDVKMVHTSFGRMHLPDRSMSTRKGNVVLLEEVLKECFERAGKIVQEKSKDLKKKEREEVIKKIAIGAIKYNILSQNRSTDITFDWDKMLSIEGNSAPYLQYCVARAQSILNKYDEMARNGKKPESKKEPVIEDDVNKQVDIFEALDKTQDYNDNFKPLEHPLEMAVARLLIKFQEYLVLAAEEYKPNLLSNYLYDLAQRFNGFYNSVSVLQADSKQVRLVRLNLTKAVARVLKEGLAILGIEVPERM